MCDKDRLDSFIIKRIGGDSVRTRHDDIHVVVVMFVWCKLKSRKKHTHDVD